MKYSLISIFALVHALNTDMMVSTSMHNQCFNLIKVTLCNEHTFEDVPMHT